MSTTDDEGFGVLKPEFKGKRTTAHVSHGKDGFRLHVKAESIWASFLESVSDRLCVLSGHRLEWLHDKTVNYAWRKEVELYSIPIDRETAETLSFWTNSWSWLDEDEDEDIKS